MRTHAGPQTANGPPRSVQVLPLLDFVLLPQEDSCGEKKKVVDVYLKG